MEDIGIGAKTRDLMECSNIKIAQLSSALNVSPTAISSIVNGATAFPRLDTCIGIANFFNISLEELVFNESLSKKTTKDHNQLKSTQKTAEIPIIGKKSISSFLANTKLPSNSESLPLHTPIPSRRAFALRVDKDAYPFFLRGDIVVINPDEKADHKDIVLVSVKKNAPIFRQYFMEGDEVFLINKSLSLPAITNSSNTTIIGKAIEIRRSLDA